MACKSIQAATVLRGLFTTEESPHSDHLLCVQQTHTSINTVNKCLTLAVLVHAILANVIAHNLPLIGLACMHKISTFMILLYSILS